MCENSPPPVEKTHSLHSLTLRDPLAALLWGNIFLPPRQLARPPSAELANGQQPVSRGSALASAFAGLPVQILFPAAAFRQQHAVLGGELAGIRPAPSLAAPRPLSCPRWASALSAGARPSSVDTALAHAAVGGAGEDAHEHLQE